MDKHPHLIKESTYEPEPRFHCGTEFTSVGNLSHSYCCSDHLQISRLEGSCWPREKYSLFF